MYLCYRVGYRNHSRAACAASDDRPDSVRSTLFRFVSVGVIITLGASVMSVITLLDTKLIKSTLPGVPGIGPALADELYGSYSAVQTLYNVPASFIMPMVIAVVPAIAAATAKHDSAEAGLIAESGLRVSAVVAMPMGVGLSVLASPIVGVLYPRTNVMGATMLSYLGIAAIFVCISLVTNSILQAGGNERLPIFSMLAGGAVKIGANLLLVRRPEINILGGPIGTIGCYAVICILNCIFIYRSLDVKPNYFRAFLRPLISAAVMGASAWAVYGLGSRLLHAGPPRRDLPTLIALAFAIGVAVLVYLVMVSVTRSLTREDLKLIPKGEKIARILRFK